MTCKERLIRYLREEQVSFTLHQHPVTYTAEELAAADHIPGKLVAKAVIGVADETMVMLVLPATYVVDRGKAAKVLVAHEFKLATEDELAAAFPDCEVGAEPVLGNLYHLPVYVDKSLTADDTITFPAGTHTESITIRYADLERLTQPAIVELAREKVAFPER